MIKFHGGPITPLRAAAAIWEDRHACVSFANPQQIELAFECANLVLLDNGAYSFFTSGKPMDVEGFVRCVDQWWRHPSFYACLAPDVIDGTEEENDRLLYWFIEQTECPKHYIIPVWHLHESLERLKRLCEEFSCVAFGSSGEFWDVGSQKWWHRMGEAMNFICDDQGRPPCKLHGLRMLDPTIFSQLPLSSADSTNIAMNIGIDQKWEKRYPQLTPQARGIVMAMRIDAHASAARWTRSYGTQKNLDLVG